MCVCGLQAELVPALHKHEWVLKASRVLCARSLRLRTGARALVHNARLIGPLNDNEKFTLEDFTLLERYVSYLQSRYHGQFIRSLSGQP